MFARDYPKAWSALWAVQEGRVSRPAWATLEATVAAAEHVVATVRSDVDQGLVRVEYAPLRLLAAALDGDLAWAHMMAEKDGYSLRRDR